jgi:Resolvase, N terminal domain
MGELSFAPTCLNGLARSSVACRTYFAPIICAPGTGCSVVQPERFARSGPRCACGGGGGYRPRVQTISYQGHQPQGGVTLSQEQSDRKARLAPSARAQTARRKDRRNSSATLKAMDAACVDPPPFDVVLIHSQSRFFRDTAGYVLSKRRLQKHGVSLVSMTQDFGDGAAAEFAETVIAASDALRRHW